MKRVVITGSTGMIGGLILEECLARNDVKEVTAINRRSIGLQHKKLTEVIHDDFTQSSQIATAIANQDICFWCVGVYTGQVPDDLFRQITVDYTREFASVLRENSPEAAFCFLSGQGADPSGKSRILFAREKGKAENQLLALNFLRTHIFRPGYIYPVTPRKEPNFTYSIMRWLWKPMSLLYPNIGVTSVRLANKMVETGFGESGQIVYENRDIRR